MTDSKPAARRRSRTEEPAEGWTDDEKAAMKERAREVKAARRGARAGKTDGAAEVLAKIAEMSQPDRSLGERIHAIVTETGPDLVPRLWYGMPAYARDDKVLCFFQPAEKFKARYATLGFDDSARLDDGTMWPTTYALTELTAADEARIRALVQKAIG